jgi:aminoglycoside 6'-N-acetyltransferase
VEDASFERLQTARLRIRRFRVSDAEALASYRSDPAVARLQGWEAPYSVAEARRFIDSLAGVSPGQRGKWFQFAVTLRRDEALIGDCALRTTCRDPRQAELGFSFATAHQRQGFASEAVGGILRYAFTTLEMHRVFSVTDTRNEAAQRLLERTGFRCEGRFIDAAWFKGAWVCEVLYAQLASEWRRRGEA